MTRFFADISLSKTAILIGVGFLLMFPFGIFGMPLYQNLIVPGDTATTANNIMANFLQFRLGIASYLIILILDVVVAVGLYVVLKQVNKNLTLLQMWLRLIYTAIAGISLIALVFLFINAYSYGQLIAYAFFIPHIFVLGYLVFKSGYIPRIIGILLIIASFCYVILLYGAFLFPQNWLETSLLIVMPLAIIGEISIGIGLLWKGLRNEIPEMKS
ncbi:MAG: DUF4386 domain-containing protein [Candidatus Bathyarchaeota archaeon]|nr:DUF4386 domain-containing protein [Candidatus Bathyarchaeota archaeon]